MRPGERISNRYKIIKEIGSGGMAQVFLAEDLILEREVAVKMMAYNFHEDEASIRRFKREALSTTELTHPNIVNVVDVGEEEQPYIVMEYVKGHDLKEYIQENHPIPYKKTITIMKQILEAVEHAHKHNIIHRDLKPQNILIDTEETVKITDFGIAVVLSENSITQTNSLLGSVHYISPEQARGSMATKQSDIYSLGILLYELLSGNVPFDGESAVSIALKHFQNDMPSLKESDPSIPQALENVVLKATSKDSNHRYQTVSEMKEDLLTSLSSSRSEEERYLPPSTGEDETKVLTPISAAVSDNQKDTVSEEERDESPSDESTNQNNRRGTKKKKTRRILLGIILLLILLITGLGVFSLTRPREVSVPTLEGLTQEEAERELAELNLEIGDITEEHHDEFDSGIVIRSNPDEDAVVRESQEIDLYVSLGEEAFVMEDYEGEPYEDVRAELTSIGITVESEEEYSNDVEEGYIIEQSISVGEEVIPSETTITLTRSIGPEGYALRDLTGYTENGVEDYADDLNLFVTTSTEPNDTIPEGQVVSQSPEPDATVYSGSRISVTYSTGPEEPNIISFDRGIVIEYEAPETDTDETDEENEEDAEEAVEEPNEIEIYIGDAENSIDSVFSEFDIYEDHTEILSFTVLEGETASFRVVRDGETIMEETDITPSD